MIKLNNVCKAFPNGTDKLIVFENLNLEIEDGKLTTILGRSGSGKSTLLNLIGAIEKVDGGEILIDGIDISNIQEKKLLEFRNQNIGFVFQTFFLEPSLSVLDNVCMPLAIRGVKKEERENKALQILEELNIIDKKNISAGKLSGGEAQRVCIARAIISEPRIILADEPTGHLDYETGQDIMKLLKKLTASGKTILLVTHNNEDANTYSDIIYNVSDGHVSKVR